MKKVILLALLMPFPAFGQIFENFESQSLANWVQSTEGVWLADTSHSLSGRFSLHHVFDNPDEGTNRIGISTSTLHPADDVTRWSFLIRYGYDPSSSNNWSVFLMSDAAPAEMSAEGATRGYAIGVNLAGSDDSLRLWKINGDVLSTVVNCRINWQTDIGISNAVKISVERSKDGNWSVSVNMQDGSIMSATSGFDSELFDPDWFGIYYRYTSTKDRLLWLDDISIEGSFYTDITPPAVTRCEAIDKNSVVILFDVEPDNGFLSFDNFSLNNPGNYAISVRKEDKLEYIIEFQDDFVNREENTLIITKLCDLTGNCVNSVVTKFTPSWAAAGDVIITEIMADPSPPISLPEKEYLEITNRSAYPFNLRNWKLSTESLSYLLPETSIAPSGIIILCSASDTSFFRKYGQVLGMKTFPSLTDGGRMIYISDNSGVFIHGIEYSGDWYKDELKSGGGWSLEMIDTEYPFYGEENWKASESRKGGSPGIVNSVSRENPDLSFPGIENVFAEDSVTVQIKFSEPVLSFLNELKNINIGDRALRDIFSSDPLFREFIVRLNEPLQRRQIYEIELAHDQQDFAGNYIQNNTCIFGLTETVYPGDILFNEVLFNPLPGDPDYLELYNNSEKIIDLSRLGIVMISNASGDKSVPVNLSDRRKCLLPGEYFAMTPDPGKISARYYSADPEHIFEREELPSIPDDKGHVILYSRELEKIDELIYSDDMHYSLLSDFEGIALEKINPEKKSEERSSWHSASETSGWGTPGAANSVYVEDSPSTEEVVLSSTKITPDNDGYEDFLTITVNPSGSGNVVSVTVFNETGGQVKKLASNLFAGAGASVSWEGTADDGSYVSSGIYIIFITVYDDSGKTKKWKKVCAVVR
jgi:hypothetical protein